MLSPRRPRCTVPSNAARTFGAAVVLAFAALAPACADDAAQIPSANAVERPPRTSAPSAPTVAADSAPPDPSPPTIDVGGRVVDTFEVPIIGRPITVVDQRGRRQDVLTDEDGGFYAMGVVPPYDVLVAQAPAGTIITPLVYLGLTRREPRFEVFEGGEPLPLPQSQPLRIGVMLPPCRVVKGACWVSVVSASATGSGATAASYTRGGSAAVYTVDHAWSEKTTRPDEKIDVHVLVGNAEYTQYAYTRVTNVPARPGENTDLGGTLPSPVPSTDPVIVAGHAAALPDGWEWALASQLELQGGAAIALRYDLSPASTMRLPRLPGATWNVGAWAQPPPSPDRPYFHRSSHSWSGALPLTTTNVTLDVPLAPEPIRPALEATLSSHGLGLAWDGKTPALASLVLVDLARNRQRFRVFTSESELSLKRLEALGLRRLQPGEHVFDLTTTPNMSVDELTQRDVKQRKGRFDRHAPGGRTYQRFAFQVTP